MSTLFWILLVVAALIGGIAIGFFIARKYMMNYLEQNPPINEDMIRTLMMQMGQKPSQKKVNQVMRAMSVQMKNEKKS
ncbi:YneF family protein [Exiguobacterium sp. CH10]|uniref:YneF family protein n=1 Tax=Exiguobacterium sp. CH10 TaxID=2751261 RepID=UPI001BE8369A|nr:YneF family protein [Exiguobacterium sp. CH10]